MTEELNQVDQLDTEEKNGNRKIWIIVAVVLVVLCCCCLLVGLGGWWLWNNGDELFGLTARLLLEFV